MQFFQYISLIVIFSGGALLFLLSLLLAFTKNPRITNFLFFIFLFCISYVHISMGLTLINIQDYYTISFLISQKSLVVSFIYLIGPINLFYSQNIYDLNGLKSYRYIAHLIIPFLVFNIICFYLSSLPHDIQTMMQKDSLFYPDDIIVDSVIILGAFHIIIYNLCVIKIQQPALKYIKLQKQTTLTITTIFCTIICILIEGIGYYLRNRFLFTAGMVLMSFFFISIFLIFIKYRQFFRLFNYEVKKIRYERSLLKGINIDNLINRLNDLMTSEKLYNDFDISLKKLSALLSITPHQLSQILNEKLNIDFRNYINLYRIEEAKKLLIKDTDRTIINICYNVGFGSKTAFNVAFKEFTRMSPTEFRKLNNKHSTPGIYSQI